MEHLETIKAALVGMKARAESMAKKPQAGLEIYYIGMMDTCDKIISMINDIQNNPL